MIYMYVCVCVCVCVTRVYIYIILISEQEKPSIHADSLESVQRSTISCACVDSNQQCWDGILDCLVSTVNSSSKCFEFMHMRAFSQIHKTPMWPQ